MLSESDNPGNLLHWDSLFQKMAFSELLLRSQLKEVAASSFCCPIKHQWKEENSWQTELKSTYSQAPEPILLEASLPKKCFEIGVILKGFSCELEAWSLDLPSKLFHGDFALIEINTCVKTGCASCRVLTGAVGPEHQLSLHAQQPLLQKAFTVFSVAWRSFRSRAGEWGSVSMQKAGVCLFLAGEPFICVALLFTAMC